MADIATAYHAVLAVKDECQGAFAACGGLRSLTAARAVIARPRAIPPETLESDHDDDILVARSRYRQRRAA
jgi:hypothetical protein